MDQRKAFCKQRILDSSCAWKGTVDIEIFITLGIVAHKNHTSWLNNKWTSYMDKEIGPGQLFQWNIYQSLNYRKDFGCPHFDNELKFQEKQQVKVQQCYIPVLIACPTYASKSHNSRTPEKAAC